MTKQRRKYIIYIAILLIFSSLAIYFIFKDNASLIWKTILDAEWRYLLVAIIITICSYALNALLLLVLTRIYNKHYRFRQGVANYMIGNFFAGITPSSSGGQFAQAYTFSKQNVKVTNAASILFMAFIIHQFVAILFSSITFSLKFYAMTKMTSTFKLWGMSFNIINLSLVGFAINVFILLILFVSAFSKKLHFALVHGVANFLKKIHIFSEEKAKNFKKGMDEKVATFRIELKRLLTNWPILIVSVIIVFVDMVLRSSYPYLMGLAINAPMRGDFFDGICMTNFTNLITMMIPIPGAAGGAELVFQFMFSNFMNVDTGSVQQYISSINLLWRIFSFYINVFLGAIVFIFYQGSPKKDFMDVESRPLSSIVVLSLTEEINIGLKEFNKNQKRKKYRPQVLAEEENMTSQEVDQLFMEIKEDLKEQLSKNEQQVQNDLAGENK